MNPAETPPLQYDVIGIGAATLDTLHLVPDFPATEGVTQIIASTTDGGGPVATALCFLAKHGLSCALLDTFGDDRAGTAILHGLAECGVECLTPEPVSHCLSATAQILVRQRDGARHIFYQPGNTPEPVWDDTATAALKNARLLHINGRHENAARAGVREALNLGIKISFDGGAGRYRESIRDLVEAADLRILSRSFAADYVGSDDLDIIAKTLKSGKPELLIVTAGTGGSWIWTSTGDHFHQPAIPAHPLVDTTGCGDIYHGAFIDGWLRHQTPADCARYAAEQASQNARALGGRAVLKN